MYCVAASNLICKNTIPGFGLQMRLFLYEKIYLCFAYIYVIFLNDL